LFSKVAELPIRDSGVDDDGDPFVVLENGLTFFGVRSTSPYDERLFKKFAGRLPSGLEKECIQVAVDIVIRYVEGGLKYGGPKKQSRYVPTSGDKVAEMGAFQGFCSMKLAQQVGADGSVVCIEPMPDNFRLLKKNRDHNGLKQMTLVNKGVWDSEKKISFARRQGDGQSGSIEMGYGDAESVEVDVGKLDDLFVEAGRNAESFMIVQLNGAEINGLRGLTSFKPKYLSIAARYDTEGVDAALAIKELLEKRGYKVEIDEADFVFAELKTEENGERA